MIGCLGIKQNIHYLIKHNLNLHFSKSGLCIFSMDKWIFGCLTTYAYDLGGTQEVSNF